MGGRIEAIAGRQQDPTLGGGLAEGALVLSTQQPGKCGHAAVRRDPAEHLTMLRHEAVKELEVSGGDGLRLAQDDVTLSDSYFRKNFCLWLALLWRGAGSRAHRLPVW